MEYSCLRTLASMVGLTQLEVPVETWCTCLPGE